MKDCTKARVAMFGVFKIASPRRSDGIFSTKALARRTSKLLRAGVFFVAARTGRVAGRSSATMQLLQCATIPRFACGLDELTTLLANMPYWGVQALL